MIIEKMHAINDYILKLNTWWGLHTPGSSGIIITKDKVYSYQEYRYNPFEDKKDEDINYINERNIDSETLKKITDYIEEKLIDLSSSNHMIFDAGFDIHVKYQGKTIDIINDIALYNETMKFLRETLKESQK